jgi:hypothetical protein
MYFFPNLLMSVGLFSLNHLGILVPSGNLSWLFTPDENNKSAKRDNKKFDVF